MRSGEPRPMIVMEVGIGRVKYVFRLMLQERALRYA
jgi:hypothetical protein